MNPYYNIFKTFRGDYNTSFHQIEQLFQIGTDYSRYWNILDVSYNYPTEIELYIEGHHAYTYYFDYHIATKIPEKEIQPTTILSVNYFNLLGQQIPKPTRGFYIERKSTDKGIISTKYNIQN